MVSWFFSFLLNFIASIFCYLTNPIVVLFCDENGELPGFLSCWQTWDDSCNPEFAVQKAPKCIQYDWKKHYTEHKDTTPELAAVGRERWFTTCIDPDFTVDEYIKRYLCRVFWLTRNCGYGFAFWVFGREVDPKELIVAKNVEDKDGQEIFAYTKDGSWLTRTFMYKNSRKICDRLEWNIFLGWKLDVDADSVHQAMIANRIAVAIRWKN